ncbi:hypothetical protein HDU97_004290 [Phlyctochytrium planicorne]|nr:hypothetical protein HDU97_004290 [Phlyctochytrium planicorne]
MRFPTATPPHSEKDSYPHFRAASASKNFLSVIWKPSSERIKSASDADRGRIAAPPPAAVDPRFSPIPDKVLDDFLYMQSPEFRASHGLVAPPPKRQSRPFAEKRRHNTASEIKFTSAGSLRIFSEIPMFSSSSSSSSTPYISTQQTTASSSTPSSQSHSAKTLSTSYASLPPTENPSNNCKADYKKTSRQNTELLSRMTTISEGSEYGSLKRNKSAAL